MTVSLILLVLIFSSPLPFCTAARESCTRPGKDLQNLRSLKNRYDCQLHQAGIRVINKPRLLNNRA